MKENINSLVEQISSIKKISPEWENADNVFLGVLVTHGFFLDGNEFFNATDVRDKIYSQIDKRFNAQLLVANWMLPEDMIIQWEKYKCRFISIAGIVVTKKR